MLYLLMMGLNTPERLTKYTKDKLVFLYRLKENCFK